MHSDENYAYFLFEGVQYRTPIEEARECCYMNDGVIDLPSGKVIGVDVCALPVQPIYIIHSVVEYTGQKWIDPSFRVKAEVVSE